MSKDKVTSPGVVQDDADLTTLVGPNGEYKALVEKSSHQSTEICNGMTPKLRRSRSLSYDIHNGSQPL